MKSKLFQAVVLLGISWGGAGPGCLAKSTRSNDGGAQTGGASGAGGITDAGTDAPADAFCDETWPTTKGNPAPPPTCDDQVACGGPPTDAPFLQWLPCRPRIGELQCDYTYVTSVCRDGVWVCPPGAMPDVDCRCLGPDRPGMLCTEEGFVPIDGGAAGAPG